MTKIHFEDLTQITCPFGLLDEDTQQRLKACDEVEFFTPTVWCTQSSSWNWLEEYTYRAKPKPKRLVTWLQWDNGLGLVQCKTLERAEGVQKGFGGYIYRIERDEDGSNPTIELVETGGKE